MTTSAILEGKTIVVTGGSSGIGRAIAIRAVEHSAKAVVIGDLDERSKDGLQTTTQVIVSMGGRARFQPCDVRCTEELTSLVTMADEFGGIDVMVCNAGIALATDGPDLSEEDFDKLVSVNLRGALKSAQQAAAAMKRLERPGSIIIISSMGGLRGSAYNMGYTMTKGGVNLMTASLADAHGPSRIRVNAICPGLINTTLIQSSPGVAAAADGLRQRMPLRRFGDPSEVGDAVAWLGSDLASFVTGAIIPVDGGQTAVL